MKQTLALITLIFLSMFNSSVAVEYQEPPVEYGSAEYYELKDKCKTFSNTNPTQSSDLK